MYKVKNHLLVISRLTQTTNYNIKRHACSLMIHIIGFIDESNMF